jgi:hypothetical protein
LPNALNGRTERENSECSLISFVYSSDFDAAIRESRSNSGIPILPNELGLRRAGASRKACATAVKDAVTVEPMGEFTLKGIGRPLAAYNVLGAKPAN